MSPGHVCRGKGQPPHAIGETEARAQGPVTQAPRPPRTPRVAFCPPSWTRTVDTYLSCPTRPPSCAQLRPLSWRCSGRLAGEADLGTFLQSLSAALAGAQRMRCAWVTQHWTAGALEEGRWLLSFLALPGWPQVEIRWQNAQGTWGRARGALLSFSLAFVAHHLQSGYEQCLSCRVAVLGGPRATVGPAWGCPLSS